MFMTTISIKSIFKCNYHTIHDSLVPNEIPFSKKYYPKTEVKANIPRKKENHSVEPPALNPVGERRRQFSKKEVVVSPTGLSAGGSTE
jgi:hypothetical protein